MLSVYTNAFKFGLREEFAYPIEIFAFLIRKLINLSFLMLFWYVISNSNPEIFSFKKILSYFLITGAISDLTFTTGTRFGRLIQKMIKSGTLSNFLIKPANTINLLYSKFTGGRTSVTIFAIFSLAAGIYLFPPENLFGVILFPFSLVLTSIAGLGVNIYIGIIGFITPEGSSVKNVYEHVSKILSGALIPLVYFPDNIRKIVELTPFPVLISFPAVILQEGKLDFWTIIRLFLSLFWALTLFFSANFFWKKALKKFEGVGI